MEGGWSNIRAFGVAVAVTWDKDHGFRRWFEQDVEKLVAELENFTHVVTFNGNRFDLEVLRAYAPIHKLQERSFDVHEKLFQQLGHRVKLDQLAKDTLGTAKSGTVACIARPAHLGRNTQVWDASITHKDTGRTIALFRCTQMVLWPKD